MTTRRRSICKTMCKAALVSGALLIAAACTGFPSGQATQATTPSTSAFASIEIWPPGPRPASAFMLSTWVYPFTHGQADFYGWDGTFLRTVDGPGNLLASVDGRYFVNFTTAQLRTSTGELVRAFTEPTLASGSTSLNWAGDGDYFCGLERNSAGFDAVVEDLPGHVQRFRLDVPAELIPPDGLRAMNIECSLSTNRAVVFGGSLPHYRAALMSMADGHLLKDVQMDENVGGVGRSPDLHWLAATDPRPDGWETELVDLTDGSIGAKLDGYFATFTPDSQNLVGITNTGVAAVIDWRTRSQLWSEPGDLTAMFLSDPSTNKLLLRLSTGSPGAGTATNAYWIVNGKGSGFRFNPRSCVPIEAPPAGVCTF